MVFGDPLTSGLWIKLSPQYVLFDPRSIFKLFEPTFSNKGFHFPFPAAFEVPNSLAFGPEPLNRASILEKPARITLDIPMLMVSSLPRPPSVYGTVSGAMATDPCSPVAGQAGFGHIEEGIHRAWTPSQACLCWSCVATSPVDSDLRA